jgi:magnesium chelatase subunit D
VVARDGIDSRLPARVGVVALDESAADDEPPARRCSPSASAWSSGSMPCCQASVRCPRPTSCATGRGRSARLAAHGARSPADDQVLQALCATAAALGVDSPRCALAAFHLGRMAAALDRA